MAKQLYWRGPGVYGTGKNMLQKGDPLPKDFPKENLERFKNKIGEKIEAGVIEDINALKAELKKVKSKPYETLEKENLELTEEVEALEKNNLELTKTLEKLGNK